MYICLNLFLRLIMDPEPDKSWISLPRWDRRHTRGVVAFLNFVKANAGENAMYHICPCSKCMCRTNEGLFTLETVWDHLKDNGFWTQYRRWIYHGEEAVNGPHDHGQFFVEGSSSTSNHPTVSTFIDDVFHYDSGVYREPQFMHDDVPDRVPQPVNTAAVDKYNKLIALQQTPVSSSSNVTVLESVMDIMKIKVEKKMTVSQVDRSLQYTNSLLEEGHRNPTNHRKVRSILQGLGLSYIKIHACVFECVLFWGRDADGNCDIPHQPTERG